MNCKGLSFHTFIKSVNDFILSNQLLLTFYTFLISAVFTHTIPFCSKLVRNDPVFDKKSKV